MELLLNNGYDSVGWANKARGLNRHAEWGNAYKKTF